MKPLTNLFGKQMALVFCKNQIQTIRGRVLDLAGHLQKAAPVDGLLLAPDPSPGGMPLEKELAAHRVLDGATLRGILGESRGVPVWCDPATRSLGLLEGPAAEPGPDGVRYLRLR